MSQTAITLAFEQHLAELQLGGQPVVPDEFVLAYIPGLDLLAPIDRAAGLPPAGQIVHRQPVDQRGKINANGVAYSIIMDTRVGDFTFNAMYLVHKASGMVAMVVHKADEDKLANKGDTQPGNSLVKSMLMEYQGAAEATNTQVDASTWQIDFTARLLGLDEDIRLQALDHYGTAAFIDGGFAVSPGQGVNEFLVAPGLGYIAGLRAQLASQQSVVVSLRPATLYADVYHAGTLLSDWHTHVEIKASSTPLTDYTDGAGYPHYVVPIASLAANGTVTDLRGRGGLWWHENRPQAHTKDQIGLSKLENWSWTHSYTDPTGGATKYATGKAVADAYNALNSSKLDKTGTAVNATKLNNQQPGYYLAWGNFTGVPPTASRWPEIDEIENLSLELQRAQGLNVGGSAADPNTTSDHVILSNHANTPGLGVYWHITTTFYSTKSSSANRAQLAIQYNGSSPCKVYARSCYSNTWLPWVRCDNGEYTAADVLAKVKSVGGASSGLDADLLDGKHGDYYRAWANLTGKPAGIDEPGQVAAFARSTPPAGWLKANGAAVSRTTYAALFAAIGTTHGAGDSSTTFNLPDLRGEFVRGWDDGRGVDISRVLGSWQAGQIEAHSHLNGVGSIWGGSVDPFVYGRTGIDLPGQAKSYFSEQSGNPNSQGYTSTAGSTETRPRNVALLYCIKY